MRRVLFHGVISLALVGELFAAPAVETPIVPPVVVSAPTPDPLAGWSSDERSHAAENLNFINAVLQDLIKRRDDPAIKDNVLMYRCLTAYVNKVRGIGTRCGAVLRGDKAPASADPADKIFAQSRIEARGLSEEAKACLGNPEQSPLAVVPATSNQAVAAPPQADIPTPLVPERAPFASPVY